MHLISYLTSQIFYKQQHRHKISKKSIMPNLYTQRTKFKKHLTTPLNEQMTKTVFQLQQFQEMWTSIPGFPQPVCLQFTYLKVIMVEKPCPSGSTYFIFLSLCKIEHVTTMCLCKSWQGTAACMESSNLN